MEMVLNLLGAAFIPGAVLVLWLLTSWVRVLKEYERGVKFRLGRLVRTQVGPGLTLVIFPPFYESLVKVDIRTVTYDVPPQDVISKDNITVKVNAVLYYRVTDPVKAIIEVEDYAYATSQIAQTTLRSIIGQFELDELLTHRDQISNRVQAIIDEQTAAWGIKVSNVELKNVDIPHEMQRAIGRQAEAERERRSKIIAAEGEFQAAEKLVEAAKMMERNPISLQMRYLQTMAEMGTENNTKTIVFPIPIDLLTPFKELATHFLAGKAPVQPVAPTTPPQQQPRAALPNAAAQQAGPSLPQAPPLTASLFE